MIKTILVPATGSETDAPTFSAALSIARIFVAHIDALHVRGDPVEVAVATAAGDGSGGGGALLQGLVDQFEHDAAEREAMARRVFIELCAHEDLMISVNPEEVVQGPSAQWHVVTGQELRWMATYGMTADLVVASRGTPDNDAAALGVLEFVLLESGRPLLIPGTATPGRVIADHVAIAWKPTPQAARAVAFALPFLARAKVVTVMTVEEEEGRRTEAQRLVAYLAWHGIKATAQTVSPGANAAESLLAAATAVKTGLLVMGGYGHTRLREWVFGGFTQRALAEASMPVLIAH